MKTLYIILLITIIGLVSLFTVGNIQNNNNDPIKNCTRFVTGTEYKGYHCPNEDKFIRL